MKLIYGNKKCILIGQNITEIIIRYRGYPYLQHKHLEITNILTKNKVQVKNIRSKSVLLHGNNQIHIGYTEAVKGEIELFKYLGYFKILNAKVNGEIVTIVTSNIDYWNQINSSWGSAGIWDNYKGTYQKGSIIKRKKPYYDKLMKKIPKTKSLGRSRKATTTKTRTGTTTRGGGY